MKYSQGNEEQIIRGLNSALGVTSGWFVEFGAWDGFQYSNTAFLREAGWSGVLIEADRRYFTKLTHNVSKNENIYPIQAFVTAENINELLLKTPLPQDFELLSIDIDGNDYWVWKSLEYRPKVVCIEYNSNFTSSESVALRYDPKHVFKTDKNYGASAAAFVKLGKTKGYTLVDHTPRLNLFFVRDDVKGDLVPLPVERVEKLECHSGVADKFIEV